MATTRPAFVTLKLTDPRMGTKARPKGDAEAALIRRVQRKLGAGTADDVFDCSTSAAVQRWQWQQGAPKATGAIAPGELLILLDKAPRPEAWKARAQTRLDRQDKWKPIPNRIGDDCHDPEPPAMRFLGYPTGPVDSRLVTPGGVGGDWDDTLLVALGVAKASGLPITSQKRSRVHTANGSTSDHWIGSTHSYAVDLGTSGAAGDAAYRRILDHLGVSFFDYPSGRWNNIISRRFRFNIGWRVSGHFDHVHVGVRRA